MLGIAFMFNQNPPVGMALDIKPEEIRGDANTQPVSVLQKRFFEKAMRPELGILVGSFIDEAYVDTTFYGGRVAMFPIEWAGLEFQYIKTKNKDSDDREALKQKKYRPRNPADGEGLVTPDAEVNLVDKIVEGNIVLAPLYGKMNLADLLILYSDIYLTVGYGQVSTEQGELGSFMIGGGERFYIFDALSFRIEYKNRMYNEKRAGKTSRHNLLGIDLGFSYLFF